jgi:hypothetical protein
MKIRSDHSLPQNPAVPDPVPFEAFYGYPQTVLEKVVVPNPSKKIKLQDTFLTAFNCAVLWEPYLNL